MTPEPRYDHRGNEAGMRRRLDGVKVVGMG